MKGKKGLLCLLGVVLFSCAENEIDFQKPEEKTIKSKITIAYGPIGKLGCGTQSVSDEDSVGEYLNASQDGETLVAQSYLLKIHRDLRCMSAYDFVYHYDLIMTEIENNHSTKDGYLYAAPLVFILTEHGAKSLDMRAQSWLYKSSANLEVNFQKDGQIADGLGFYFARGTNLISMQENEFDEMIKVFKSTSWFRSKCSFVHSVIVKKGEKKSAIACLNDSCPITEDNLPAEVVNDENLLADACSAAREELNTSKNSSVSDSTANPGSSGPSYNDGFPELNDGYDDAILCANNFNDSGNSFACLTQVAVAGNRIVIDEFGSLNSFNVGVEAEIGAKGCNPNPLQQSNNNPEKPTESEWEELDRKDKKKDEAISRYSKAKAAQEYYDEVIFDPDATEAEKDRAHERWAEALGLDTESVDAVVEYSESQLRDMTQDLGQQAYDAVLDYAQTKAAFDENHPIKGIADDFMDSAEDNLRKQWNRYRRGWDKTCDVSDPSGCSQTCGIEEQKAKETARCIGLNNIDSRLQGDSSKSTTSGLGNPEEMLRNPDDVETDSNFSELVSCLADTMGIDTLGKEPGDSCGEKMLCTNHEFASVDDALNCSCANSTSDELDDHLRYESSMACQSMILCQPNSPCSCGNFGEDLASGGGITPDPSVMLRVYNTEQVF